MLMREVQRGSRVTWQILLQQGQDSFALAIGRAKLVAALWVKARLRSGGCLYGLNLYVGYIWK